MARFRYMGEPARPKMVKAYGPCIEIRNPMKNGTISILQPIPPATEFVVGEDIGYDITDERAITCMRASTRFEEIV